MVFYEQVCRVKRITKHLSMPPKSSKGASVILYDANSNSAFKEGAIDCVTKICARKLCSKTADQTILYLMNAVPIQPDSKETCYSVKDDFHHFYQPFIVTPMEEARGTEGNWLKGVRLALNQLCSADQKLYFHRQLVVLSDFQTKLSTSDKNLEDDIKYIIHCANTIDCHILFLGINSDVDEMLTSKATVYDCMQKLQLNECNPSYKLIARIKKETMSVVCNFELGTDLFFSFKQYKRGYPFVEPLSIGGLKLPTSVVRYIKKQPLLKLKTRKEMVGIYRRRKFALAENQEKIVAQEDVTSGILLHDKFIFLPKEVAQGLKAKARYFKLLGFTDWENIPDHHIYGTATNMVLPYQMKDPKVGYLNYVVEAADKYNKYGVVLKAYAKNTKPKLFCLIPKTSPHHFILCQLPYAEDFRMLYKESDQVAGDSKKKEEDQEHALKEKATEELFNFLDSVNIDSRIKLHPNLRLSNSCKLFADKLGAICVDRPDLADQIQNTSTSLLDVEESSYDLLDIAWDTFKELESS